MFVGESARARSAVADGWGDAFRFEVADHGTISGEVVETYCWAVHHVGGPCHTRGGIPFLVVDSWQHAHSSTRVPISTTRLGGMLK